MLNLLLRLCTQHNGGVLLAAVSYPCFFLYYPCCGFLFARGAHVSVTRLLTRIPLFFCTPFCLHSSSSSIDRSNTGDKWPKARDAVARVVGRFSLFLLVFRKYSCMQRGLFMLRFHVFSLAVPRYELESTNTFASLRL